MLDSTERLLGLNRIEVVILFNSQGTMSSPEVVRNVPALARA